MKRILSILFVAALIFANGIPVRSQNIQDLQTLVNLIFQKKKSKESSFPDLSIKDNLVDNLIKEGYFLVSDNKTDNGFEYKLKGHDMEVNVECTQDNEPIYLQINLSDIKSRDWLVNECIGMGFNEEERTYKNLNGGPDTHARYLWNLQMEMSWEDTAVSFSYTWG